MRTSKFLSIAVVATMISGCAAQKYQVYFQPGSTEISAASKSTIMKAAKYLDQNPHSSAKLSGYTDGTGSSQLNKNIALKRINSTSHMLKSLGIEDDRISTEKKGKRWLFSKEAKADQSQRRVDILMYRWW